MSIKKEELIESLVPSHYYREYLKSINYQWSDLDIATLAWNKYYQKELQINEIKKALQVINDKNVKNQINERLEHEKKAFEKFCQNPKNQFVYVVIEKNEKKTNLLVDFFGIIAMQKNIPK